MNLTIVLALVFAVPLGLEWRYRLRSLRIGAAVFAMVALFFAQPSLGRAVRRSVLMPPAERVTQLPGVHPLSEYEIGVFTLQRAVTDDWAIGANARGVSLGVLFWLACSTVFRGRNPRTEPDVAESRDQAS